MKLKTRTTQDLLNKIKAQDEELYCSIMQLREKYSDICIDLTRKEAMALQQKTLNKMFEVEHLRMRTREPLVPGKTLYYIR